MGLSARDTLERHMQAIVDWNMDLVVDDLIPEVAANAGPLVEELQRIQVTGYEFHSETKEGDNYVFNYKYIEKEGSLPLQSTWSLIGDA